MHVQTTKGDIPIEQLVVKDLIELQDNARVIATEWHLDGELVRRDVAVSVLRGHNLSGDQQTEIG